MNQNIWIGIGRLTKNPEFVPAGKTGHPHITFVLAVNRVVPRDNTPQADYFPCVYWGEDAKDFLEKVSKGDEVAIVGRIYTEMAQGRGDRRRAFFWEIRVDHLKPGRKSLKNLSEKAGRSEATSAVDVLHEEFGK